MLSLRIGATAPCAMVLFCYFSLSESFTSKFRTPTPFVHQIQKVENSVRFIQCNAKKGHSEFSVVDEDDDDGVEVDFRQRKRGGGDLLVINEDAKSRQRSEIDVGSDDASSGSGKSSPLEYAALRPGTVVQVQVGDLSLARKAWKKRRRTGSPLLVPCSILNVDRRSAVRWNLIFLLEKFGQPGRGKRGGIVMSLKDLASSYRKFLKSSLGRQAAALGFDSNQAMIEELFNKKIQESYGVFFDTKEEEREYEDEDGNLVTSTVTMLYLTAPISRLKAQQRASNPAMLQFRPPREGDYDGVDVAATAVGASVDQGVHVDDIGTLTHTGWIRSLKETKSSGSGEGGEQKLNREYTNFPLSACLRVSQKDDLDTGRVLEGNILPAVVFDFDKLGDGGSPLLTLSLNAASGGRQRLKIKPDRKYKILKDTPKYQFKELKVGDGPYRAKVIKLIGRRQKALVDLGVGRELSSAGGNAVQVLGTLRYKDSVELVDDEADSFVGFDDEDEENIEDLIASSLDEVDDYDEEDNLAEDLLSLRKGSFEPGTFEEGEIEEDISALYEVDENGQLVFKDPETGELKMVEDVEDDADVDGDNIEDNNTGGGNDISDEEMASLFSANEDGSITYKDPETGETMTVKEGDEEYDNMMMMKSLIDDDLDYVGNQKTKPSSEPAGGEESANEKPKFRSKRLQVGEYVEVYISNVSKQSNQFQVTTNPLVKGQKAKDIKKEAGTKKKLDRLKKNFGGNLDRIYELKGTECEGIVKAASKTGDWLYVQPGIKDLPVGVAALNGDGLAGLSAGDNVRVRLSGIDEERGQLSMDVIDRL
ncbi:unnamed protein product [Pseudo-nitzschia multistriata]|uniref:S1 motif domain-containing protein n=1 Tax=Pseudo-nitzschia multistriata TaxID=183589 RepID=A0A448Z610_9STRA|nr:unnamed protein product [Pseudo-nitzschia multistriata]